MSLLAKFHQLSETDGGMSAGDISVVHMPLFSSLIKRNTLTPPQSKAPRVKRKPSLKEAFYSLKEAPLDQPFIGGQDEIDTAMILARLKNIERKQELPQTSTVTFGLEDENGNTVKVSVDSTQSSEFEAELARLLPSEDLHTTTSGEIAEILFILKDQFNITNVQWPEVEQDEETQQPPPSIPSKEPPLNAEDDLPGEPEDSPAQVSGLLAQVIDMMKADAEARKAEAHARESEAKTKQADSVVAQTLAKVKQEEQFLDMESYQRQQQDQDKEVKRLAQLAHWKQQTADQQPSNYDKLSPEEEEYARSISTRSSNRITPSELGHIVLDRIR